MKNESKGKGIEEYKSGPLDITPTKKILWAGVSICDPRNAITEIQDNLIDYVAEKLSKGTLQDKKVVSLFELSPAIVRIWWNQGIPKEKRMPLLTPGLHNAEDNFSIGTWSMGGKIALHAFGDDVTIRTCTSDDEKIVVYHFPSGWLFDSNEDYNEANERGWTVVKDYENKSKEEEFTEIVIKRPNKRIRDQFNKDYEEAYGPMMNHLLRDVGETYGLTFQQFEADEVIFDMRINGSKVKPVTFSSPADIIANLNRTPGFEPTLHTYDYKGLKIEIIVGCTNSMDKDYGGMYFYGNHGRLFASKEKNSEYLDSIDVTHPQKKHWQMHVFFTGNTNLIPWSSPLKANVNYHHETMSTLKPLLNKLPTPYIELVLATHAPERYVFIYAPPITFNYCIHRYIKQYVYMNY